MTVNLARLVGITRPCHGTRAIWSMSVIAIFRQLMYATQRQHGRAILPNVTRFGGERRINGVWDILFWNAAPLGPRRHTLAVSLLVGGILTFFLPLISIDPPVFHTSHWSPFDVVKQMYLGHLLQPICERCGEPMIRTFLALPFDVTVVYGLMLSALVAVWLRRATLLAWIGILGACLSLGTYMFRGGANFATKWEFETTFYGQPQSLHPSSRGPVLYGWLTFALFAVLVFIALREDIDRKPLMSSSNTP
jgi:hypothetical protein